MKNTKEAILEAGLALWREDAGRVNARAIGNLVGLTHAGVLHHFKTSARLKSAVADYAVASADRVVIPQLIVANHPAVAHFDQAARQAWLAQAG